MLFRGGARGNQVWYDSFAPFQKAIQDAGATFVPCDELPKAGGQEPERGRARGEFLYAQFPFVVSKYGFLGECRLID